MDQIVFLGICLGLGVMLRVLKVMPSMSFLTLNMIILYISLPSLVILNIPKLHFDLTLIWLVLTPWLHFIVTFVLFHFIGKKRGWSRGLIGCLVLTTGLANTSFVGLPLIEAFLGVESLKHALLLDQGGSFLIVSTLGIAVAAFYSEGKLQVSHVFKKVITFPPFLALCLALILGLSKVEILPEIKIILERLGQLLTPLALISVGFQLRLDQLRDDWKWLVLGLNYKLVVAPIMVMTLFYFIKIPQEYFKVILLESAMAPMIVATILASTHNLESKLAHKMLALGVPLSIFTVALWSLVL